MIECPSCGMPVKKGANHCSACGEAITGSLTSGLKGETKRTSGLEAPTVVEEVVPPTVQFATSGVEPKIQTCLRCNSVLNPAAKFCSVCGRATEPTPFERTVDVARNTRTRAAQALRRAVSNVREHQIGPRTFPLASLILFTLSVLCLFYSFFAHPSLPTGKPPDFIAISEEIHSVWWLAFGSFLLAAAAFFKR